ncbi:EamA-like transporter family protein [Thermodesulfobium acidiphilum]|uniref:EamA-like transporter family protein n=1 Tax=Thermodesulfobium acidiphilum TaxID=1794699 RepID=A0A2R4W0U6_THEAF|nr:EamA-like transporter family protein [Thermodesulfobium acidiphilum]
MKKHIGQLYLALAVSIWGGIYVMSKMVLTVIQRLELVWLRYLVALVTLIIVGFLLTNPGI